jgi:LmbE family N-acetylglucosaminyl deacetylase
MNAADYLAWLRSSPVIAPSELVRDRPLLVISPHPDDESLGCGGLIGWAATRDLPVTIVFLTDGERSHEGSQRFPHQALARLRRTEAMAAAAKLGVAEHQLHFLGLPDGGMVYMDGDALKAICFSLLALVGSETPLICVTARTDPHGDHQAAWMIAMNLARYCEAEVLSFPIWTWSLDPQHRIATPARRAWRLPLHDVARKQAAIAAHRSQLGEVVHDAVSSFAMPKALLDIACYHNEVLIDERV